MHGYLDSSNGWSDRQELSYHYGHTQVGRNCHAGACQSFWPIESRRLCGKYYRSSKYRPTLEQEATPESTQTLVEDFVRVQLTSRQGVAVAIVITNLKCLNRGADRLSSLTASTDQFCLVYPWARVQVFSFHSKQFKSLLRNFLIFFEASYILALNQAIANYLKHLIP